MTRFIGKFLLGHETVKVFCDAATGEASALTPGQYADSKVMIGEIVIGLKHDRWSDVLENILHEAEEYLMTKRGIRYEPDSAVAHSTQSGIFVMDHVQFQDMIATTAQFVADVEPALKFAHKIEQKHQRQKKSAKKKRKRK